MKREEKIVISVGGSLIVPPSGIDIEFLKKLNSFIRHKLEEHPSWQFFLVCGGGHTTRSYQKAAKEVIGSSLPDDDVDWLGIHVTRLNGHLLRTIFRDIAHLYILEHFDVVKKVEEPVAIGAGWKPGRSTDYCAVQIAQDYGAKTVINLSNFTQVFDKDPDKNPDALPHDKLTWPEFRGIIGDKWSPGLNTPFDPEAAKKAEKLGLKVVMLEGTNFPNLEHFFTGKPFLGTVIE